MRGIRIAVFVAGLAAFPAAAWAHHGWGSYDSSTVLAMEAQIIESSYEYPHGGLVIEYEGERWNVVLAPPSRLERRGIWADELKPGLVVTVEGYPSKVEPNEMRAERIILNGRTVELR